MKNPALQLQRFLPYKLSRLVNDISIGLLRTYSPRFGLNVSQWRMLAAAAQLEPTSVTELTEYSGMDKVTVSRSVREMVERKLLTRELDESDRRRATIELTPEGRRIYEQIAPAAVDYEEGLLSALDDSERKKLEDMIDRLLDQAAVMRQSTSRVFPLKPRAGSRGAAAPQQAPSPPRRRAR
ncbi:MAG: MarR family winged helix-turn-helix transcriptional regulator [Burkholderiaceae bacterium]